MGTFRQFLESDWYHGTPFDFPTWDANAANKIRNSRYRGIDSLGMWVTSSPTLARIYGPHIYKHQIDLKKPYQAAMSSERGEHAFEHAFVNMDVARDFLTKDEQETIQLAPYYIKINQEFQKRSKNDEYVGGKDLVKWDKARKELKKYTTILDILVKPFNRMNPPFERNGEWYIKGRKLPITIGGKTYLQKFKEHLVNAGHDSILFPQSTIDVGKEDMAKGFKHDVAIVFGDEHQPTEKFHQP